MHRLTSAYVKLSKVTCCCIKGDINVLLLFHALYARACSATNFYMSANHSKKYMTCRQASGSVRRKHGCFCNKHASSASIPVSPCGAVYRNMFTPKLNMCIIYYLVYIQYRVKFLLVVIVVVVLLLFGWFL